MRDLATLAAVSPVFLLMFGCVGGARLVLKSPIQDQCTSAGLLGCEDIADGATLYADGNAEDGERKLARGLRRNASKAAELKKFADGLVLVGNMPGAGQFVAPLRPAIKLVQDSAAEAAERQSQQQPEVPTQATRPEPRERNAQDVPPVVFPSDRPREMQRQRPPSAAVYWLPSGNALSVPCRFPGTPKMLCLIEKTEKPREISDLMISSACPVDVLVSCRHGLENDWVVYAAAGKGADIHGAALPITQRQSLTIAVAQKTDDALPDIRCGVSAIWHESNEEPPEKTPQQLASEAPPAPPEPPRAKPTTRSPGF